MFRKGPCLSLVAVLFSGACGELPTSPSAQTAAQAVKAAAPAAQGVDGRVRAQGGEGGGIDIPGGEK